MENVEAVRRNILDTSDKLLPKQYEAGTRTDLYFTMWIKLEDISYGTTCYSPPNKTQSGS